MASDSDHSEWPARGSLAAGTMLGRYRILTHIASGGSGEVYRVEDTELKRQVALKLLSPSLSNDVEFKEQFRREAQIAASLNHPNVVSLYDFGEYRDRPYAVMELVTGRTVQELLDEGPVEPSQTLSIVAQVCRGLQVAHEQGLVHRDIKPANIVVDETGRARLLDFGLAGPALASAASQDEPVAGTVAYMSPEQATGGEIDHRSDLFSVGTLLYVMLTHRKPFDGEYEAAIKYAIVNEAAVPVTEENPAVPEQVAAVVGALLEKEPANRPLSAGTVADVLQDAGGERPSWGIRFVKSRTVQLVTAVALITIAALTYLWPFRPEPSRKMLVVLPFENVGSAEDDYFADGMTNELTRRLATVHGLGVISRTSAMQYKAASRPLPTIAHELGVEYVLEGTVHWDKSGEINRVRVTSQLINVGDDTPMWNASFEEDLTEVFRIQSDIAEEITRALDVTLRAGDQKVLAERPTGSLDAYDCYLRGNEYFYRSWDSRDIEIAIELYRRAVALDSRFARAWAMLCRGHESMYWEYYDHTGERLRLAQAAVDTALALQPDLTEAHLALGFLFYHRDRDYEGALSQFRMALERKPSSAELYNAIGAVQRRQGKLEESAGSFIRAYDLDPRSHINAFEIGLSLGMLHRYHLAIHYLDKAQGLRPDWPLPYIYKAWLNIIKDGNKKGARAVLAEADGRCNLWGSKFYWWLARIVEDDHSEVLKRMLPGPDSVGYYLQCGRMCRLLADTTSERAYSDSALELLRAQGRVESEDAMTLMYLGLGHAGLRRREPALRYAAAAVRQLPTSRDAFDALFLAVDQAEIHVTFGYYEEACSQLAQLLSMPGFVTPSYLMIDPLWAPLRNHKCFRELLRAAKE